MKRKIEAPEISLANFPNALPYYKVTGTDPKKVKVIASAVGKFFRPDATYKAGAEEAMHDKRPGEVTKVFAPFHTNIGDPLVLAGWLQRNPDFRWMLENCGIPSKFPLFTGPVALRRTIEWVGAYPTVRHKDLYKTNDYEPTETEIEQYHAAVGASKELTEHKLVVCDAFGGYIGGERSEDRGHIENPKTGFAESIINASLKKEIEIYPIGCAVDASVSLNKFNPGWLDPAWVVGAPITDIPTDKGDLTKLLVGQIEEMQAEALWQKAKVR